ncbi:hypothetical protein FB451DRAFT_1303479 [Mycena latifolia]|nr:hypothetical protein FB451DRAFT_1303479 [Mycena latifolia]
MLPTIPQENCIHTLEFAKLVRALPDSDRCIPIVAMDAYKVTDPADFIINKSFGKYSHHYILAEIGTAPPLFARVDFQGGLPLNDQPVAHSVLLSPDRAAITPGSASFARFSNGSPGGPTLDAFASLLEIMHARTPYYDVFSRNCLWLTECILYTTGRRYADHWRAGYIAPVGLGRYINGLISATMTTAEIYTDDPATRFFIDAGLQMLKGIQWLFTLPAGNSRIRLADEEIGEILWEWDNRKELH